MKIVILTGDEISTKGGESERQLPRMMLVVPIVPILRYDFKLNPEITVMVQMGSDMTLSLSAPTDG